MTETRTGNFSFGENFEEKFIKDIVTKPDVSLIELVSNSWDAGATEVHITWPIIKKLINGEIFEIKDNGHGMTEDEFYNYWQELGFDKRKKLGNRVKLKDGTERQLYGRNGKGRLGLFAFSNSYTVSTSKNKVKTVISIKKKGNKGDFGDFKTVHTEQLDKDITGTSIKCEIQDNYIDIGKVKHVLSTRFGANPTFKIYINNHELKLLDLKQFKKITYQFEEETIEIIQIPRDKYNKKLTQYQIVWWVNEKGIETNKWRDLNIPLNARNPLENKYVFNIIVNFLEKHVKPEGINFDDSNKVKKVKEFVAEKITELSQDSLKESHLKTKNEVIKLSKKDLQNLNPISKKDIGNFIEKTIEKTSITADDLSKLVSILTTLDRSVHRYDLLNNLAKLTTVEMDKLNDILDKWSVEDAYTVLDELYWRLELITKLEHLTEDPSADELKQIHPLFNIGLWMFGPQYEGNTNFKSNSTLRKVLSEILKVEKKFDGDAQRPDLVATSDGSIWDVYSQDKLQNGMIVGYQKILVIELKRGGFKIGEGEMMQAYKYVSKLIAHGKLQIETKVLCIVLGSTVDPTYKRPLSVGNDGKIYPCTYDTIIRNGKLRTLNLIEDIKNVKGITDIEDYEINEVLREENAQKHLQI